LVGITVKVSREMEIISKQQIGQEKGEEEGKGLASVECII